MEDSARLRSRLVALTRDLMLIPSIPSRPDDLRRCHDFVKNHLEAINGTRIREFERNGYPSLIAAPEGCERPQILMCAHCDVITHPDLSVYRSKVHEGRIYGPGAGDMKGALAILLELFRSIQQSRAGASIGLAVTSDEETGGASGMGYLFGEAGVRCGEALIPDGGSLAEVTVEEKGILHLKVTSSGRDGHAARPWLADNAIDKMMAGLERVRRFFNDLQEPDTTWHPTCSITLLSTANETINRIPAHAEAVLDIRFPPPHTVASVLKGVKAALDGRAEAEVIISAEATHLAPDPMYLKATEEVTGEAARLVRDDGGSDARFITGCGIPVMMSRPLVGNLHGKDEWIDIESMLTFYRIYESYLRRKFDAGANGGFEI